MRRFVQFLLVGCFLVIPAVAQRGGGGFRGGIGGFRGGGFVSPGFRGGFNGFRGGFRGGFYPGNRFVFGFGFPYWPYYGAGWGYPYPYYGYPYYPYPSPYAYPSYNYGYVYNRPDQTSCPRSNGDPLYLIKLTYQNNVWVAEDYWYTEGTLNFTTVRGEQNKTPIDSIDRALTIQLNRDCGVVFQLPR